MQVRNMFPSMFFSDFPIFEPKSTRIGRIIKPCIDPIAAHNVITVFPNPSTK